MGAMINTVGNVLFFLTIGAFAVWVFYVFFTHLNELRSEHPASNHEKSDFNDSNLKEVRSEGK